MTRTLFRLSGIAIASVLFSIYSFAADIDGRYSQYSPPCQQYITTKNPEVYRGWIEGYLSGLNETMLGISNIKEKVDITTDQLLVQSYVACTREPGKAFSSVVSRLVDVAIEKAVALQKY